MKIHLWWPTEGEEGGQWLVCGTSAQNVWVQTLVRYISIAHLQ